MVKSKKEKEAAAKKAANTTKRRKTAKNIARIVGGAASGIQVASRVTVPEHIADFFVEMDSTDLIVENLTPNVGQDREAVFLRDLLTGEANTGAFGKNISHAMSMKDPIDTLILTSPSWGFELLPFVPFAGKDAQRLIEEVTYEYAPKEIKRAARRAAD